jgi:hypothetical protein
MARYKGGKSFVEATAKACGNGSSDNSVATLVAEATNYIKFLKGEILSSGSQNGSGYVMTYRLPNVGGTDSIVVALRKNETVDDFLRRLVGNAGMRYSPKWRNSANANVPA